MRVLVVDDEPIIRMDLVEILLDKNCTVVAEASDGKTAVNLARSIIPDVVLMDIKMPGDIDGMQAAKILIEEEICPVVLLTAYHHTELIEASTAIGVFGYLVKPIKEDELYPALRVAVSKWEGMQKLKEENVDLKNKLEKRKIIEKAKGVLMDKYDMKEKDAYRKIQKMSMEKRTDMIEIAKSIILSSELISL
ncbi:ANTAR domain-containing response regulator [Tepidanaerobacter syntrophicus]|uniref:ANTAR domain-containing response regulator n=1 Tax=Tepidanaerobacter syntrophicus TaxID=224999 RepID=UPI001BD67742|nr:response regulator [Tepidanaerobacter syntrophicus]